MLASSRYRTGSVGSQTQSRHCLFGIGLIASGGGDQTVQVWNATTGERIVTYSGHTAIVLALSWSPDSKRIASGADWRLIMGDDGQTLEMKPQQFTSGMHSQENT